MEIVPSDVVKGVATNHETELDSSSLWARPQTAPDRYLLLSLAEESPNNQYERHAQEGDTGDRLTQSEEHDCRDGAYGCNLTCAI